MIMELSANSNKIAYTGRVDRRENETRFYYVSSQAEVKFRGTEISVSVNAHTFWGDVSLGYIIDGREGKIPLPKENDGRNAVYQAANSLEADKEHTFILFKRAASNYSFSLISFSTDGEFLDPAPRPSLKLEFYGDSVSAGEVCEAVDFAGRCDPASHGGAYDNCYHSYTWQTARLLGAQLHNIAQGGIAVFDDTGWFHAPKMIGMESVYDKLCYFPEAGEISRWDFSKYIPDIVVFALGQNDQHNGITGKDDIDIHDPDTRAHWKEGYKKIARSVLSHYPTETSCIFLTTLLMHDPEWDKAIDEIVNDLKSEGMKTYHFLFRRNGAATPGHPRIPEHTEMATELSGFIRRAVL